MNEIKDLYNAGSAIETTLPLLEQALSALMITMEAMEDEGIQPEGKMDKALALHFAKRFPMYYKTLEFICRDMWATLNSLQDTVDSIFKAYEKQREAREATVNEQ